MNLELFAFVNRQLAGMLRAGLPLESGLRQVARDLQKGRLRDELEQLEADLSRGVPLAQAVECRRFPELYKRLLIVGSRARDLPAVLNQLADHYRTQHQLWLRLRGLLIYPCVVLLGAFLLSCLMHFQLEPLLRELMGELNWWVDTVNGVGYSPMRVVQVALALSWAAFALLGLLCVLALVVLGCRRLRERLAWSLPAFRESRLAQLSGAMALLLKGGVPMAEALSLLEALSEEPKLRRDLSQWRQRLAQGYTRLPDVAAGSRRVPPLFVWLAAGAGEDWASGFAQAAGFYEERARDCAELMLSTVLPVLVLVVGGMVFLQGSALPLFLRALLTPL